ncbi:HNH endonuclease [Devosia sp. ZW T5_3]|uniref:HNH endonuclease n=1 Tax=Devosia sp. ZW T5_3 TaxID=3378085 RepID=UPI0038552ED7
MKAVFDTKPDSGYGDELAHRYHFPPKYLELVEKTVGDWVVFRRPRADGGSMAYLGVGMVVGIEPDIKIPGHNYALISDFLPFDAPVPWVVGGRYFEGALRDHRPLAQLGLSLRGRSVRLLEEEDFEAILAVGLAESFKDSIEAEDFAEQTPISERRIERLLVTRKVRDANFRRQVRRAYDFRCAITGLRIVDRFGRSEAQAAHIHSVAGGGPDLVQNGLALTSTVHWLFDKHLISIDADFSLLIAVQGIPPELSHLIEPARARIHLPLREQDWPQERFLTIHRAAFHELAAR